MKFVARTALANCAPAAAGPAGAQESSDFLTLHAVGKTPPQYRSWRVAGGGSGMCRFEGEHGVGDGRGVITHTAGQSVMQQFRATPATGFVRNMKAQMGKTYKASALPGAGPESLSCAGRFGKPSNAPGGLAKNRGCPESRMNRASPGMMAGQSRRVRQMAAPSLRASIHAAFGAGLAA